MEACGAMRGALKPWPTQKHEGSQGATQGRRGGPMRFLIYHFILNSIDILRAGIVLDRSLLRAEFLHDHRVGRRAFVANLLPRRGVGAEIGVFTGLFSRILLGAARPKKDVFYRSLVERVRVTVS